MEQAKTGTARKSNAGDDEEDDHLVELAFQCVTNQGYPEGYSGGTKRTIRRKAKLLEDNFYTSINATRITAECLDRHGQTIFSRGGPILPVILVRRTKISTVKLVRPDRFHPDQNSRDIPSGFQT